MSLFRLDEALSRPILRAAVDALFVLACAVTICCPLI
jgi:hypothetical protein